MLKRIIFALRGVQRMQRECPIPTVIQTSDGHTISDEGGKAHEG